MSDSRDEVTIVTHDGFAHMDEVVALAICTLWLDRRGYGWEILRSRDTAIIDAANIVFDVGGVYDPEKRRFDHHQKDFSMIRDNGIPYASAGLAWTAYGYDLCGGDDYIISYVDRNLIQPIDAYDNGISLTTVTHESNLADVGAYKLLNWLQPTWQEDAERGHDAVWEMVEFMRTIIPRISDHARARREAHEKIQSFYNDAPDKRILILDDAYPWREIVCTFPETLYVVYPKQDGSMWYVSGAYADVQGFEMRALLPVAWRGVDMTTLRELSGIPTASFTHKSGFLGGAETIEDAILMAVTALVSSAV